MLTIQRHDDGKKGFVEALEGTIPAGKMTFTWAGETKLIIDHTEVGNDFGGKGVGKKMLMNLVEYAREKQVKILPICPFAAAMFKKDSTIGDVLV